VARRFYVADTARLLSIPLGLVIALPLGARQIPSDHSSSSERGLIAEQQSDTPAEVQGWIDEAFAAYERGDPAQALRLQLQALEWTKARLAPVHLFRAQVLDKLADYLWAVGREQESQASMDEADKIRRKLAMTIPGGLFDLAHDMYEIGGMFRIMGRHMEALSPAIEKVKIRRELVKTNPAVLGDLAKALDFLGVRYIKLGRPLEALAPMEEAVKIRRGLAKTNREDFLSNLAHSLNNLGICYAVLNRRQEALAASEEAVTIFRELGKSKQYHPSSLSLVLNNLGFTQLQLGQSEIARNAFEESIAILRPLAADMPQYQNDLQRTLNNLDELNRQEGIRTGATQVLGSAEVSYLPKNDPTSAVKRAVVRLWPTFSGKRAGVGLLGTGFVVRRHGGRAWIATALHVLREPASNSVATKVEAELFTGPLPPGLVAPRLEVVLNPSTPLPESGDEPILLELRGLPPDVQPLPLATTPAQGVLTIVGHPRQPGPWTVVRYSLLTSSEEALLLAGGLADGASGSPVLSASQQVVGVVYDSPEVSKSRPIAQTWAFPVKALAEKMK
jgi:tetratricopeptide (TPR) repeat protein